ncbi:hypothetical protein MAR_031271 [Mya arenaria]|uniref:Uncharacterized protein n=1 Tax=Mya arenaria TaxID=6604 RepID=A0ABY7F6N7_MYAAR|nr:hypothetical protein MAR_031271 [Mya arenaria]
MNARRIIASKRTDLVYHANLGITENTAKTHVRSPADHVINTVYVPNVNLHFFPNNTGQCETCNSKCVANNCDSSSGRCIQGCYDGYWNRTCNTECDAACFSCKQTNGSCSKCKNNTRYGPDCRQECSNTCKSSVCDVNGSCINGCIVNTFGKQCEQRCGEYCLRKDNQTICSEKTGMCLYGCRTGYTGKDCPQVEIDYDTVDT